MAKAYHEIRIPLRTGHIIEGCWYGNRAERPILALHGWQDNAGTYALLAPLLSKHVAILAIDLPGHGRSSHNASGIIYHTLDFVRVIKEIMFYFKWPRVSLMGHSMGACVSYIFMALFPQQVDMMISIDVMHSRCYAPGIQIAMLRYTIDKFLEESERSRHSLRNGLEPPTYTWQHMEELVHKGSEHSVELDKAKYILERNTSLSRDGAKFFFSRDGGVKFLREYNTEHALCLHMARKMTNIKWLVLKGGNSHHIDEQLPVTKDILELQQQHNANFSYHVIPDVKHHCQLNNAEAVAEYILPFLQKQRPPEAFTFNDMTNDGLCKL